MARILCVDDAPAILAVLRRALEEAGHECVPANNVPEALQALAAREVDLILSDFQMPVIDGLEFLEMLRRDGNETPLIMVTAFGGVDHALRATRAGADDYLTKPFEPQDLLNRVELALRRLEVRRELAALRHEVAANRSESALLGTTPAMRRTLDMIRAVAGSRATVLIEGESGTGKELIARALHEQSERQRNPFIRLNCAALPEGLIESALFGHEKGAFTGAIKRVEGAFERAHQGTLLLDEISELRLDLQAKLLRVLQEQEFERVGGTQTLKVDVRVVATTNRNLKAEAEQGTFRQDLYYRLTVVPIKVPPLRERIGDIPLLAHAFASRAAAESGKQIDTITPDAIALLQSYGWPGNVRELQHTIERAVVLARGPVLDASAFADVRGAVNELPATAAARAMTVPTADGDDTGIRLPSLDLDAGERALIAEALRRSNDNRTHAAALLGIGVRTLRKKLAAARERHPDE